MVSARYGCRRSSSSLASVFVAPACWNVSASTVFVGKTAQPELRDFLEGFGVT
jgi:hypothetical protein